MPPHYFWNTVLTFNSFLLTGASVFLVYGIGMLVLEFDWRLFVLALTTWIVLVGFELILATLSHE